QYSFFDPVSHLSLTDAEKLQCEKYIKNLITDDIYPLKRPSSDYSKTLSSTISNQVPQESSKLNSKPSTYDDFIAACGGESDTLFETSKEKSKRVSLNEEIKHFRTAVQDFNLKHKPSTTSAVDFWKKHHHQLPMLSNLA
ncbi:unnamed protein product, partial [Rotaria magnacalcarata]